MKNKELVGIQYLRGLAALAVVVDHAAGMAAFPKYFGVEIANGLLLYGALGVDIFFVISGFIITLVSLSDPQMSASQSFGTFFLKRFVRIVPLMWLAIVSYYVLRNVVSGDGSGVGPYIRALFLVPFGDVDPNQIWTLRHEAVFYTVFAISFLPARQMRNVLYAWIASPLLVHVYQTVTGAEVSDQSFLGIVFSRVNLEFGTGFLIGSLRLKGFGRTAFAFPGRLHPLVILTGLTFGVIGLGALCHIHLSRIMAVALISVMAGWLIFVASRMPRKEGALNAGGLLLGNASYSIYLFHPHVESAMLRTLARFTPWMNPIVVVAVVVIIATAAGVIIHIFVEKPLVRMCQQWLASRKPSPLEALNPPAVDTPAPDA